MTRDRPPARREGQDVEIVAEDVEVAGPHGPLLSRTSLRIRDGELLLVTTDTASASTALALVLGGRLRPERGHVRCDRSRDAALLRRRVAIVDAPDVTEPDGSLLVRDVAAEGLTLAGCRSGRRAVRSWLDEHEFDRYARCRFDRLHTTTRTRLLLDLARQRSGCGAMVLDRPDRHGEGPSTWHPLARREAARGSAVIVLCAPHSATTQIHESAHPAVDDDEGGR